MVAAEAVVAPDRTDAAWRVLRDVMDPEIPVLSIVDLGIVRFVRSGSGADAAELHVGLSPTYSGCPATEVIRASVVRALIRAGFASVRIENVLSPPWTSDWITAEGRQKLLSFGIAPPVEPVTSPRRLFGDAVVPCPRCGSGATERISEFGSTPCKAHYRCTECLEPFDYFKCL